MTNKIASVKGNRRTGLGVKTSITNMAITDACLKPRKMDEGAIPQEFIFFRRDGEGGEIGESIGAGRQTILRLGRVTERPKHTGNQFDRWRTRSLNRICLSKTTSSCDWG